MEYFDNDLDKVIKKRRELHIEYMSKILDNVKVILDLNKSQLSTLLNEVKSKCEEEQITFLKHIIDKLDEEDIYRKLSVFLLNFKVLLHKIANMPYEENPL